MNPPRPASKPSRKRDVLRRLAPLLVFTLLATSCFDLTQPVEERLVLGFLADGGLHLKLSVELRHRQDGRSDSGLERRLRKLEEELLGGLDPWPRRFAEAPAAVESFFWEKDAGRLVYLERNLVLDRPEALATVLAETPIQSIFRVADGVAELDLVPGLPDRATRRERREMDRVLLSWIESLAAYFAASADLYTYLEGQPHRAVACFGEIFEDEGEWGDLTREEDALIEAFADAAGEIVDVLDVDAKQGYSLEELSRRVFDPFPALFEVELPSRALEIEGFERREGRWVVPGLSLWASLEQLEGQWLSPDPVIAWVEHERSSGEDTPFDVIGFAARERFATTVDAREIRETVEEHLRPASVYRLTWPIAGTVAGVE